MACGLPLASGTMTFMTTADPAIGIERLNALVTPDLWKLRERS
jgi:hypothetical protein